MDAVSLVAQTVFWACLVLTLYAYLVYPACIWLLARSFSTNAEAPQFAGGELPEVTLIVAAHNEQAVIEKKIRNSLELDYPRDRLRVVIASDGSSDATPQIVSRFADRGLRLLDYRPRRGKSAVLNSAIAASGGEILVLSDANTEYQPDAVRKLVRWFADPRVDVVCGRLLLKGPAGGTNLDSAYWRYETFLKTCEGRLGALLGANGGIYAIRRRAYVPIPDNTIVDDLVIPLLSKLRHKGRIVYDPAAVAAEETPAAIGNEFRRRARIGTGAYQSLPLLWRLLNPRYGWSAFAFLSHKILRWLVPFFLLGLLVSNLLLLDRPLFPALLALHLGLYAIALVGAYLPGRGLLCKLTRVPTMFIGMNIALLAGFWRWLTVPQTGTWDRTSRSGPTRSRAPPVATAQLAASEPANRMVVGMTTTDEAKQDSLTSALNASGE
jgi:cellulose synthase/poly-beta-1,6-N-acetylglucosamine synthase-like glycosyltransferase